MSGGPRKSVTKRIRKAARKAIGKRRHRDSARTLTYDGPAKNTLQCCIAYNELGGYCVPRSSISRPAAQRILAGRIWEPDTIEYMTAHVGGGDIVHAGTYFGDFLPALSRSLVPSAMVWAFEPNLDNFRCARLTLEINDLRNVKLANSGLGDVEKRGSMVTADSGGRPLGGASYIVESVGDEPGQLSDISITTIDSAVPSDRNVSVIQLDVERFEEQALKGGVQTIARCRPILILENLPSETWMKDNIYNLGYGESSRVHRNIVVTPE